MSTIAVVVAAVLAVLAVLAVARPFLRDVDARGPEPPADAASDRLRRAEERDRALLALKELEFDHRTGKLSDDDYRKLVGPLRQEVARALRALDGEGAGAPPAREEATG